jgi:uncharacterized protein (TIGR03435 family)
MVAAEVKKPVVDRTGLAGTYDFEAKFLHGNFRAMSRIRITRLFVALQEQPGLRLMPQKVPVDHLVIDRVERVPDAN